MAHVNEAAEGTGRIALLTNSYWMPCAIHHFQVGAGKRRVDFVELQDFAKVYQKPISYFERS